MLAIPKTSNCSFYNVWKFLAVGITNGSIDWNSGNVKYPEKPLTQKGCVLLVRHKNTIVIFAHSRQIQNSWEESEKKKERGCTFFTVQHLWSVLTFFLLLTSFVPNILPLLRIRLHYYIHHIFSVPAVMWFVQTAVQMFPPVHKWVFTFIFLS